MGRHAEPGLGLLRKAQGDSDPAVREAAAEAIRLIEQAGRQADGDESMQ
jgi:hypothetical protein